MERKNDSKRRGVSLLQLLLVLAVLAASCLSLCDPHCRERTTELAFDGVAVGLIVATLRLLHFLHYRRVERTLLSWWCLARPTFSVELRHGLVGGYLLGITRATIECLF